MKGLKVIDAGVNPEYGVTFGTCEFCFWSGDVSNPWMELEFPDGTTRKIDTYYWDWGEYEEAPVVNVVDFSAWLQEQELEQDILDEFGTYQLMNLIESYDREKKGGAVGMRLLETYDGHYYNIEQIVKVKEHGNYLKLYMNDGKCFYYYCDLDDFLERIGSDLCE